jgi:hypothetical protein
MRKRPSARAAPGWLREAQIAPLPKTVDIGRNSGLQNLLEPE